ncbi:MAG: 5-carboxymethyl-2-hydroxymuconate semialdehyde dehydrogenase [Acidimicrobiales bacterium]
MNTAEVPAQLQAPHGLPAHLQHYVGGKHVDSTDGSTFNVSDPASNSVYATVASGGSEDVDQAVAAAGDSFLAGTWKEMGARQRSQVLRAVADMIEARDLRLAELESFDTGLPISQALGQAKRAAENFRFFADVIVAIGEESYRVAGAQLNYVVRKPVGVAGLITPWNTPFMLESWKLAPALASGCSVVLKPAERTPLSASLWPEIFEAAGLPPGAFNMVHGLGERAGQALVDHPGVPLISFTGETTTGETIMRRSAACLKGLSLELGGKSPVLVFADADLEEALDAAIFGVFSLNGERCTAGSRLLVERAVYNPFLERLADRASRIVVGPPSDPRTEVGALVHPEHHARVLSYVRAGLEEGARLVSGGARPPHLPQGNYLEPTVFADVTPSMRIFQEEIFGPVVTCTPFDTEDEAVRLANSVRYGLAAYVWTSDLRRGHRVAQSIDAGMVWLNSHNVRDLRTPFGGVKASGLGREGGVRSIDFFCEPQVVHVAMEALPVPRFGLGAVDATGARP